MRIVFMGTPGFAVFSLIKLASSSHNIVGVVTRPDKPKGRGRRMTSSPVKKEADKLGLPVYQPEDLNAPDFIEWLRHRQADCFVVVGFRILPLEVFELPHEGTVNLHASLLPRYRGAAPIQWALIRGEKKTGVTTFFIEKKVDTGDMILQAEISIEPEETAGELHDRLGEVGGDLLVRTMDLIAAGSVKRISQTGTPSKAPKILPEHCRIDWAESARRIVNRIRGLSPRPGAFSTWENRRIKILRACVDDEQETAASHPGRIALAEKDAIIIETGEGCIRIQELQMEGKQKMSAGEFLRGREVPVGTVFK
jgi:methionyl-tRNA formyltransferase